MQRVSLYKTFRYRSSINRAYYPMFYCALALINTREISSSKHSGVISIFDKEFVKTGEFPKYTSKWIHEAFMKRQESDYLDFKEITQEEAELVLKNSHEFYNLVYSYLNDTFSLFLH